MADLTNFVCSYKLGLKLLWISPYPLLSPPDEEFPIKSIQIYFKSGGSSGSDFGAGGSW